VLDEIALKYVEIAQTKLPVAALRSLVGPLQLSSGASRRGTEYADFTSTHSRIRLSMLAAAEE
jgi:ubiquinone biosynthesis protein Coq4